MAKVTVHDEPKPVAVSDKVANGIVYVTDPKNRKLGLRQPDFLEEFRIIEAVGSETAANITYMAMLNPLLYLAEIDGEAVAIPRSKMQAEALIKRVGREGFLAIVKGIEQHFAVDEKAFEEKVKNG